MREPFESIECIQDVFSRWRELGSKKLADGTELIAAQQMDGQEFWLHAVFPRLERERARRLEGSLQQPLPLSLRRFYRSCGGLVLFAGLFRLHGLPRRPGLLTPDGLEVDDIVALNHRLECSWKPDEAVAIATSGWDASVYLVGMGVTADEIVRVAIATGQVLERTRDIWRLVADKLYRLDELFTR